MNLIPFLPKDSTFWYLNENVSEVLKEDLETDIVIIGGGMGGLSAAQAFNEKGLKVILLEKNFCGSGASGKSSGFITPDSELSLSDLIDEHGTQEAKKIWGFINSGVDLIRDNIEKYNIDCDFIKQDTLILASNKNGFKKILEPENNARIKCNYESTLFNKQNLKNIINSEKYFGGLTYSNTFGINGYKYCKAIKEILKKENVKIFEETPAIEIQENIVKTPSGSVKAKFIVVCADYMTPKIKSDFKNLLENKIYHAQTYLMISSPLTDAQIKNIFPDKSYMAWDTDLVFNYFRLTSEKRLLVGGASLLQTYAKKEIHNNYKMVKKLTNYIENKFEQSKIQFDYGWPGLIGISKDLAPIAGFDNNNKSIYYITAAAGLPIAAALGKNSVKEILENNTEFQKYFSPYRKFKISGCLQKILGTKATFAISNFMTVKSM